MTISAQEQDKRHRTVETIVADGLAQLPAQDSKTYNQVISEMANTGQKGIEMLAAMLSPAGKGKNASFEYAIDGIASYVTASGRENLCKAVREGLITSLAQCSDKANQAFLMTQLQKCATSSNAAVFEKYLGDSYLQGYAIRGLASTPGIDSEVINLMKSGKAPKRDLAYLAYFKKLKSAEPILLEWLKDADEKTQASIYNALTTCGSSSSLSTLQKAAQSKNFILEPTSATDAYLQFLNNLDNDKTVQKAAKKLLKNDKQAIRCAALRLFLKTDKEKATKNILAAIKDQNDQYRSTALFYAKDYAGNGIFDAVAKNISSLPVNAQTDVVRWLGNNKVANQIGVVNNAMKSNNETLVKAAIVSAGQIGGNEALKSLIAMLAGNYAPQATEALTAFNGNINDGVVEALSSSSSATQISALKLASTRRIYSAYNKIVSMTNSSDATIKSEAYDALKGVAKTENFAQICDLMEKAGSAEQGKLQEAAKSAIHNETADNQYNLLSNRIKSSSNGALYYPLLAQSGSSKAISKLKEEYAKSDSKDAAFNALLQVNNPEMVEVLFNLAKENAGSRDAILKRYITMVKASNANSIKSYLLYRRALELNPSADVQKSFVSALADSKTMPALMLASEYLDNQATSVAAASTSLTIITKNAELQKGSAVKNILQKAQNIFRKQKEGGDADAGYAVDEITNILPKITEGGYEPVSPSAGEATTKKAFGSQKKYENCEIYAEWKTDGNGVLSIRSMQEINLDGKNGVSMIYPDKQSKTCAANVEDWNSLYVKIVNDRIFVISNGDKVAENTVIKNTPNTKPINANGLIQFLSKEGNISIRDMYINELPATPIFTLSNDEKKAGYEVLFDGRSLEKWQGNTAAYVPVDGNLFVNANYGTGNIYTKKKYSNFIYRFEFCFVTPGVNNGVGIRTEIGSDAAYDGMEIQILDHDDPIYKGLQPYQQHGAVYGIIVPKRVKFGALGTWNTEEIQVIGDHIKVTVNGEVITDGNIREACKGHNIAPDGSEHNPYTVDHKNHPGLFNKDGYVSFCGHGAGVKMRNVRILDLSKKNNKK